MNKNMSVFIYLYNLNAEGVGQKEGTESLVSAVSTNAYVMMHMHK